MTAMRGALVIAMLAGFVIKGLSGLAVVLLAFVANELLIAFLDLYDRTEARAPRVSGETSRRQGRVGRSRRPRRRRRASQARLRRFVARVFRRDVYGSSGFPSYERIVSDLAWARYSQRDFDVGMRRRLLEVAQVRLTDRYAVDLERRPDAARALLGEHTWSVLEPGRPASSDRGAPGVRPAELARVVTALEALDNELPTTDHETRTRGAR